MRVLTVLCTSFAYNAVHDYCIPSEELSLQKHGKALCSVPILVYILDAFRILYINSAVALLRGHSSQRKVQIGYLPTLWTLDCDKPIACAELFIKLRTTFVAAPDNADPNNITFVFFVLNYGVLHKSSPPFHISSG